MGNKWDIVKLDEIAKNASRAFNFKNKNGVIFINTGDVLDGKFLHKNISKINELPGQAKKAIKINDILFSEIRPGNSRFALVNFENTHNYVVSTKFMILEVNQDVMNLEFFYLQLTCKQTLSDFQHIAESRSGTFPQITFDSISHYPFYCPDKVAQVKIKNFLGLITKNLETCYQINQTLEQISQTLFKSWFVDFDPVIDNALDGGNTIPEPFQARAELRKKVRNSADFKPLAADVRALFPAEFEEIELGWVPKGWQLSMAGDEFVIRGGSTPSTANADFWDNGEIHWTSPKDLAGNTSKILIDTSKKITTAGLNKISSGLLPENTVLMSSRAPIGYLALTKIPLAINQGYIAIPSAKSLSSEYIIYWLENIMDDIKGIAGGTTFAEISKSAFKTINLIIPSQKAIEVFTHIAKDNFDKIVENSKQTTVLKNLRDTLLPKLISGELSLDDIPELYQETETI
ncbi:restriction endonuclease subunit S [Pragia fontium]|uniref:Type I restriction enzyme, S subunit n=1 Tax=Pragia fontium DSM 5563 = ATCC 49100 TaxID=1122977 RepID=A0AAJ4WCG8_9GAMM|nr:restriction endonuclease subunit S [Pragia fontium]SFD20859.1 type I restriction enzyme, S subunit [Pragia fontium DSM 5563 = ATCC 49100]